MKTRLSCIFVSVLILFFASACSKRAALVGQNYEDKAMLRMYSESAASDASFGEMKKAAVNSAAQTAWTAEKKLIKTGNVSLEVTNLAESISKVESWAENFSGYVASSSSSERDAWFSVRVPSADFENAMNSTGSLGKVLSHGMNSEDVSEQYYDLESRIQNKKVMKAKLENYLKSARDIKDLLQIEKELNSVISEIDSMEGRLKRLSNQVDYSTISVSLSLPSNHTDTGFIFPDIGEGFSSFISTFLDFFLGFVKVFFLIVLCGIPILAALSFFYWILFGKVGVVIRLFDLLKRKK